MRSNSNLGSSNAAPSMGSEMMEMAMRFQERNRILVEERRKLQGANARLAELQEIQRREQQVNDQYRRRLLQCTNDRNEVELEIFAVRDQIHQCEKTIAECEEERNLWEQQIIQIEQETQEKTETIYGPNILEMEMYLRALEDAVEAKQTKVQKQRDRIEAIRAECSALKKENESLQLQKKRIKDEIDCIAQTVPNGQDGEISSLSRKIRDHMSEVRTIDLFNRLCLFALDKIH
jgi:chromosome segregation ATPase